MIVDWASVVFPASAVQSVESFVGEVRSLFDETIGDFRSRPAGLHGYQYSIASAVGGVLIAWGGARTADTFFLQIPGDACARVRCWATLREFIAHRRGWLSRVDLAYDSIDGAHDLSLAVELYQSGAFQKRKGAPPSCSQAGNWLAPDGKGRTLYIGKRENGKQLCVYEKGLQLAQGKPCPHPEWVRWELRLSNVHRVLPLDSLTDPAAFFKGGFPCFDFIGGTESCRIPTRKAQDRISLAKLVEHARESYGPMLDVLVRSGATAVEVVEKVRRDGIPRRLSAPTADELVERANLLAQLAINEELQSWED